MTDDTVYVTLRQRQGTLHQSPTVPTTPGASPGSFPTELKFRLRTREGWRR